MNKNTIKAIVKRIDQGMTDFYIGENHYEVHYDHPVFKPFVLCYTPFLAAPLHVGNVIDGQFISANIPVLKK